MQKWTGGKLYTLLSLFTKVKPGEAVTAFLLGLNIFLLLTAYYIIKPVREGLILGGVGAKGKSYLAAVTAVLLVFVVKAFSGIASRVSRQKLIAWVTVFFISNLVIFYFLSLSSISQRTLGLAFFVWMGIFSVMVVAQFWGFANDLYSEEEGKRLFPLVAVGATFGAFAGSQIARWLVGPIGLYQMMLVSAGLLLVCTGLTLSIHKRETRRPGRERDPDDVKKAEAEKPLDPGGGFQLLFKKKYLIFLAFFVLFLNFVNTNGEYILGDVVTGRAIEAVDTGMAGGLTVDEFIARFWAGFYRYSNLLALLIQLFVVSRIFKWIGVRTAIFILPVIALGGYSFIAAGASLMLIHWVKVAENGTDYSLMNTTRHALFLVTTREEKYKAKAAIDTFFHRAGDVFSAVLVLLGTAVFSFRTESFAVVNVCLILIWLVVAVLLFREHKRLTPDN
ncbi:MAG: translocase [Candidatus Aminicenantes bacterium]|nr:translocase [Candidatus Aminicenantes bacterium]